MALYDHFHPPLKTTRPWEGFHSSWAAIIAHQLNAGRLPSNFVALAQVSRGTTVEIDVATFQEQGVAPLSAPAQGWSGARPNWQVPVTWNLRDLFEIRVIKQAEGGPRLAAAIELVSPANKDRPAHRQTFAGKCAGYLRQGISVVVVDVVTERRDSLHQELVDLLELNGSAAFDSPLYAVAYRTVEDGEINRLEIWAETLVLGGVLPTLPLWLSEDLAIPLDLEKSYQETCRSLRIE